MRFSGRQGLPFEGDIVGVYHGGRDSDAGGHSLGRVGGVEFVEPGEEGVAGGVDASGGGWISRGEPSRD